MWYSHMKKYLESYLFNRPLFYSLIRPKELELFAKEMPLKEPVLDFGCGDGFFAGVLFNNQQISTGIDIDRKALHEAKKTGLYKKLYLYDGKKLPFKNGSFPTVISNCVLEHVENIDYILSELARIMKKGGRFHTSVMTNKWEDHLIGTNILGKRYLKWMRKIQNHLNLYSETEWKKTFERAGFKVVSKTGYVDKERARLIELFHYLSIDSLITKKILGKWVVLPGRYSLLLNIMNKYNRQEANHKWGNSAVFFTLQKR